MVVKLRLARFGRRHQAFYRLVAADSRTPRNGRCLEYLGSYNPHADAQGNKEVRLQVDRIKYWLSVGAQPSDTVAKLISMADIVPDVPKQQFTQQHVPKTLRKQEFSTLAGDREAADLRVAVGYVPSAPRGRAALLSAPMASASLLRV